MPKMENFGAVEGVAITVLVDNRADLIVRSTETVKRFTDDALLAEHGFAALIQLPGDGPRILWDAGITRIALPENARRMEVDLTHLDAIALSHGHGDHTGAMLDVIQGLDLSVKPKKWAADVPLAELRRYAEDRRRVPLVLHPAVLREHWGVNEKGEKHGPGMPPPYQAWEAAGAELVVSEGPYRLTLGCWTTGFVPRRSFERSGIPTTLYYRDGDALRQDFIDDDQAIVLNVKDKGLVVLSGCAHSGIVNTVAYAREISGVERVWAVLGGFHLARADDEDIQRTIEAIQALDPVMIAPSHCTGFKAIAAFARAMPAAFVEGVVGTTYVF
ncbi:MAG: MBL fold metallo-hydrolase [Anaerolineae bacterium]|nr:MBL fold metallo-hydrolase [Anaerolineae bacterium]